MVWTYIILSYLSLFALGFADNVRGPIYPEILTTFGLDHTHGSMMFTVSSFMGFVGGWLIQHFLKRLSLVSALQISMLLMTIGLIGMGGANNFPLFLAFAATFGLSMGFLGVLQNLMVTMGAAPDRKQQFLSGLHSMYGLASLLSPLLVAFIGKFSGDWRLACYLVALVPFLVLVGSLTHTIRGWRPPVHAIESTIEESKIQKDRWMVLLSIAFGFYVLAEILISSRLALLFREVKQLDFTSSSEKVAYLFILLFLGRLIFTFLRINVSVYLILSASLLISASILFIGLTYNINWVVLSGFTMAPFFSNSVTYLSDVFQGQEKKAISYLISLQSILIFTTHFLTGWLTDLIGIRKVFYMAPTMLLASFLILTYFHKLVLKKKNL